MDSKLTHNNKCSQELEATNYLIRYEKSIIISRKNYAFSWELFKSLEACTETDQRAPQNTFGFGSTSCIPPCLSVLNI